MKILFTLLVFGVLGFGGTIPVTGSGSFSLTNFSDSPPYADVNFSGSDGLDSVSLFAGGIHIGAHPPSALSANSLGDLNLYMHSTATVDGIESNYWSLSLGEGYPNYLNLLDASGNVLISQAIQGVIQITSYEQNGPQFLPDGLPSRNWIGSGTFIISPALAVPEASSGMLLCIGICCMVLAASKKRRSTHF